MIPVRASRVTFFPWAPVSCPYPIYAMLATGSTYAYGVLDTYYKYEMELGDAHELARRSIYHAAHRDGASGGVVRVYHIHENGWTKLTEADDVRDLYHKYNPV